MLQHIDFSITPGRSEGEGEGEEQLRGLPRPAGAQGPGTSLSRDPHRPVTLRSRPQASEPQVPSDCRVQLGGRRGAEACPGAGGGVGGGRGALPWCAPHSEGAPPVPKHPAALLVGQPGLCRGQHKLAPSEGPLAAPGHGTPCGHRWAPPAPRSQHHRPRSCHGDLLTGPSVPPAPPPRVAPQRQSPAGVPSTARASWADPQAGPPFPGRAPTSERPVPLCVWGSVQPRGPGEQQ